MLTATVPTGLRPEVCRDFLKVRHARDRTRRADFLDRIRDPRRTKRERHAPTRVEGWGFSRNSPTQLPPSVVVVGRSTRAPHVLTLTFFHRLEPQGACFRDSCRYAHSGHETTGTVVQVRRCTRALGRPNAYVSPDCLRSATPSRAKRVCAGFFAFAREGNAGKNGSRDRSDAFERFASTNRSALDASREVFRFLSVSRITHLRPLLFPLFRSAVRLVKNSPLETRSRSNLRANPCVAISKTVDVSARAVVSTTARRMT
jgi:hypothetical protein